MAAYPLTEFHEALRALLGDEGDDVAGYDFTVAQLNAGLRSVVRMGKVPCLTLDTDPDKLAAPPSNPDTWGYLVANAALLMIGGKVDEGFRTRALTVLVNPAARENAIRFLDQMIADLDAGGNICGSATDLTRKGLFATTGDLITYIGFVITPIPPIPANPPIQDFPNIIP